MKGLELSERFYEEFGAPMLQKQFPALASLIAVGLAGSGSECFGYDDELSQDHDFEPGFCLFLPGEDVVDRRAAFLLERGAKAIVVACNTATGAAIGGLREKYPEIPIIGMLSASREALQEKAEKLAAIGKVLQLTALRRQLLFLLSIPLHPQIKVCFKLP